MHYIIILLFIFSPFVSSEQLHSVEERNSDIECDHDSVCGYGHCWRGFCETNGYCVAYWTCV